MRLGQTRDCGPDRIPRMDSLGPLAACKVRGATRGQGCTHGDQRTWWRGLRVAERRKPHVTPTISSYRFAVNQDFGSIVVRLTAVASTAPQRLCASTPIAPLKRPNRIDPSRLLLNQECGQRCRSGQSPHSRVLSAFQNYNSSRCHPSYVVWKAVVLMEIFPAEYFDLTGRSCRGRILLSALLASYISLRRKLHGF